MPKLTKSEQAVKHVLKILCDNPEVMYHMGWGTQSFALLTEAEAEHLGVDRREIESRIAANSSPRELNADSRLETILDLSDDRLEYPDERRQLLERLRDRLEEAIDSCN